MDIRQDLIYGARWSRWEIWPIFQVKQSPERVSNPFYRLSCAIVHGSFGDLDFRCHFCQNFSWTSVKTLAMELICPDGKTVPFSSQMSPEAGKPPVLPIISAIVHGSFGDTDF
ncbi:hypothetical protein KY285_007803 [Solanum tuberosum]|nr:hypothetical protein KY285_007803 [Solanum tuberosum]